MSEGEFQCQSAPVLPHAPARRPSLDVAVARTVRAETRARARHHVDVEQRSSGDGDARRRGSQEPMLWHHEMALLEVNWL